MRWLGIDEAGYGPNLGPLVMTAVVAEGNSEHASADEGVRQAPDLWADLAGAVARAGGDPRCLWVDDSKRILTGGKGQDRLEMACLAVLDAIGLPIPATADALFSVLGAGGGEETELVHWQELDGLHLTWPAGGQAETYGEMIGRHPLDPPNGRWKLSAVRSVLLGPDRFNERLAHLDSKAAVHFSVFSELLEFAWGLAADGRPTAVAGDKHGGRHFYLGPLTAAFPDIWIERGTEGPELSEYRLKAPGRSLELRLSPKADQTNGLVALASIVSKTVREVWMDGFNAWWASRVPGLRPTAGYPVDAARFRREIEPHAQRLSLKPDLWCVGNEGSPG